MKLGAAQQSDRLAPVDRTTVPALTGLRFVAALWVVALHIRTYATALFPSVSAEKVAVAGALGVDVFFILSGFILTYNYLDSFRSITWPGYRRFLGLRLARIYPVHVFTVCVLAFGAVVASTTQERFNTSSHYDLGELVENLLLVHAWAPELNDSYWNVPSWSISAEWLAYLWFPFLASVLARVRSRRVLVVTAVAALVGAAALMGPLQLSNSPLVRIAGEFVSGSLLAGVYLMQTRPARAWSITAAAAGVGVLVACTVFAGDESTRIAAVVLLSGVIVYSLARSRGFPASLLATRSFVFLGEGSYALYMTHYIVIQFGLRFFPGSRFSDAHPFLRVLVLVGLVAAIFCVAIATYLIVERPARRFLRGTWAPLPHQPPIAIIADSRRLPI